MLVSIKHTSDALQTLGLSAGDTDSIMLDLEDSTSDSKELTATLSTNFMDEAFSFEDLEAEFALMMSSDSTSPGTQSSSHRRTSLHGRPPFPPSPITTSGPTKGAEMGRVTSAQTHGRADDKAGPTAAVTRNRLGGKKRTGCRLARRDSEERSSRLLSAAGHALPETYDPDEHHAAPVELCWGTRVSEANESAEVRPAGQEDRARLSRSKKAAPLRLCP